MGQRPLLPGAVQENSCIFTALAARDHGDGSPRRPRRHSERAGAARPSHVTTTQVYDKRRRTTKESASHGVRKIVRRVATSERTAAMVSLLGILRRAAQRDGDCVPPTARYPDGVPRPPLLASLVHCALRQLMPSQVLKDVDVEAVSVR